MKNYGTEIEQKSNEIIKKLDNKKPDIVAFIRKEISNSKLEFFIVLNWIITSMLSKNESLKYLNFINENTTKSKDFYVPRPTYVTVESKIKGELKLKKLTKKQSISRARLIGQTNFNYIMQTEIKHNTQAWKAFYLFDNIDFIIKNKPEECKIKILKYGLKLLENETKNLI